MTYCVGLKLNRGLVFMSDTRTNAGLDNISTYRKMFTWVDESETVITLLTAGNLATTQSVVSLIDERNRAPSERGPAILQLPSMFQVAKYVGNTLKEVIAQHAEEDLAEMQRHLLPGRPPVRVEVHAWGDLVWAQGAAALALSAATDAALGG